MPDYADWPSAGDIDDVLGAAGGSLSPALAKRFPALLDAVVREVSRRTLRQFKSDSVDTTKRYDGSGTAELEIDEIVSLTCVACIGGFGAAAYDLSGVQLVQEAGKPITSLITARGSIPGLEASTPGMFYIFPCGRQNIEVTGRFGYGAAIPATLWNAVAEEVTLRLLRPDAFDAGRVKSGDAAGLQLASEQFGDERRTYKQMDTSGLGWHENFEETLKYFKRPQGRRLRNLRGAML